MNHSLIPVYLQRSTVRGGGARSVTRIALEQFKKRYRKLLKRQKDTVDDIQVLEHQWRNDHPNLRVFSTKCKHWVTSKASQLPSPCKQCKLLLSNNRFTVALQKPPPADENYMFTNKRFRDVVLGEHYARTKGLKALVESTVWSHFLAAYLCLLLTLFITIL